MSTPKIFPFNLIALDSGQPSVLLPALPYTFSLNSSKHAMINSLTPATPFLDDMAVSESKSLKLVHPSKELTPSTANSGTTPNLHRGVERKTGTADRQSLFFCSSAGTELYLPGLRLPTIPAIEPVTCQIITILFTLCLVASVSLWVYTTLKSS
ncbi:hypothetical protein BC835DRAFT_1413577 [Cytidiella melzeri]|nr:hypothetical protein BC835DRAFT_1413577 [Cytidiella melzeri]